MKKILAGFLSFVMVLSLGFLIPISAKAAVVSSGVCGENVTWELDDSGTLTIKGTGKMSDYDHDYIFDYLDKHRKKVFSPWINSQEVKEVIIEAGVTSIGSYSFKGCKNLKRVTIPNGVTNLGEGAFYTCKSLESLEIPHSVTYMGHSVFLGCTSLKTMSIPDSVTTLGPCTFEGCSSLESVRFPDNGTDFALGICGCSSLKSVDIPYGVTVIAAAQFDGCTSLERINIPTSVTTLQGFLFNDCLKLKSITIPGSVTNETSSAFAGSTSFESITFLSGITSISYPNGNTNLKTLNIPNTILEFDGDFVEVSGLTVNFDGTREEWNAVEQNASLKRAIIDKRVAIVCNDDKTVQSSSAAPTDTNPTTSSKPTVTSKPTQNSSTTSNKPALENVSSKPTVNDTAVSSTIEQDTESALLIEDEDEQDIDAVSSQADLQTNGDNSTLSPTALIVIGVISFILGAAVVFVVFFILKKKRFLAVFLSVLMSLSFLCFMPITSKAAVASSGTCGVGVTWELDDGGTLTIKGTGKMNDYMGFKHIVQTRVSPWFNDDSIKKVVIQDGVTSIGKYTFKGCTSLESVSIPSSVTDICEGAFFECKGLKSINIPDGVININYKAFSDCTSLKSIKIPKSVTKINSLAFGGCTALEEITYLTQFETISYPEKCPNIKKLNIPECVTKMDGEFGEVSGLTINYKGSRAYWDTVTQNDSLKKAIGEKRVTIVCEDDKEIQSSLDNEAQSKPTSSSEPATTSNPISSSASAVTSKPTQNSSTTSNKPALENVSSKSSVNDTKVSSIIEQDTESSILIEDEDEQDIDAVSSQTDLQTNDDNKEASPTAAILIGIISFVFGAAVAAGVLFILKKKKVL